MIFFNLTNGIEAIKVGVKQDLPHFVRIQSTWCEQKRWLDILADLDYTFLMACRIARNIIIIDYSAKKPKSRACFQGVAWIQYVLNYCWYDIDERTTARGNDCTQYFKTELQKILRSEEGKRVIKKLKYFEKFNGTGRVNIQTLCGKTIHDGDNEYYKQIVGGWSIE